MEDQLSQVIIFNYYRVMVLRSVRTNLIVTEP